MASTLFPSSVCWFVEPDSLPNKGNCKDFDVVGKHGRRTTRQSDLRNIDWWGYIGRGMAENVEVKAVDWLHISMLKHDEILVEE